MTTAPTDRMAAGVDEVEAQDGAVAGTDAAAAPSCGSAPGRLARVTSRVHLTDSTILLAVLVAICVGLSLATANFATINNLRVVGLNVAVAGIVAGPATLLIIAGQIDLSIGVNASLVGLVLALLTQHQALWSALLLSILVGLGVGAVMGIGVAYLRVGAVIMSLGAYIAIPGLLLVLAASSVPIHGFSGLGNGRVGGVPVPILLWAASLALFAFLLHLTKYGRWLRALGGGRVAARRAGIPTQHVIFVTYLLSGAASSFAGLINASYLSQGSSVPDTMIPFTVLTAVILGGGGLEGGAGSIVGTMLGVILIGVIQNGAILLNWNPAWAMVIEGFVLIAAVAVQHRRAAGGASILTRLKLRRPALGDGAGR